MNDAVDYSQIYTNITYRHIPPKKEAIGVWTITNTNVVELLEINYGIKDTALIRFNNELLECVIQYSITDDYCYIVVGTLHLTFDECTRFD